MFDVRPGEYLRTFMMTLYLMLVLFAYYILKPVSRAIFLDKFDIDKLPWLYVLIAAVGGVFAYFYTKLAVKSSLKQAVNFATVFSIAVMVIFWWFIRMNANWIVYAFNIWVSLFSILLVSQGWLIAANIFTSREAKRVYGILGVGSVIGAAFGGTFTGFVAHRVHDTTNLILASAGMVALSYVPFWVLLKHHRKAIATARAADEGELDFSFAEILGNLRRHRHLQVIMAIMVMTFIIDVMVEYQFNAMAKGAYHNKKDLTAFLGNFYGPWLNLVTFIFQFFLTTFIVSRFGVGGTLQIMPVAITLASIGSFAAPGVISTAATRLTEASTRYSFNKTGMELLYLPLPLDLRNRTKAFVDVFVDRFARGLGGMILILFTVVFVKMRKFLGLQPLLAVPVRYVAVIVMVFGIAWIALSAYAKREYITTVRKRLESRRLDLESARVSVDDPATIALLEQTVASPNARQATYALSLLDEATGYDPKPLLKRLADTSLPEVRAKVYEMAAKAGMADFRERANADIRSSGPRTPRDLVLAAVRYVLTNNPDLKPLAMLLLNHPNPLVVEGALVFVAASPDVAQELIGKEWLSQAASSEDPARRRLAAIALRARGDQGTEVLHALLEDNHPAVVEAACTTAGALGNREYLPYLIRKLPNSKVRGAAIQALAAFGGKIVGTLGDLLDDTTVPLSVRLQIPRVLRLIPAQRAVEVLLSFINTPNLALRSAVLRALNHLRETAPDLDYGTKSVTDQLLAEAHHYYELNAALQAFREQGKPRTPAGLLIATLEDRLKSTLERLFRLLGLRYPPRQIYAAFLAVRAGKRDDQAAALEFLDSTLERDLKRIVVPILDDPASVAQRGADLFGIQMANPEAAMRKLLESGDEWLVACAIATAGQLRLTGVMSEIGAVGSRADGDIPQVARDAMAMLA